MWDRRRGVAAATGTSKRRPGGNQAGRGAVGGSLGSLAPASAPLAAPLAAPLSAPESLFGSRVAAAAAAPSVAASSPPAASANNKHQRLILPHKAYSSQTPSQLQLQLQLQLDHSLSALGITTDVTHKYRIVRGKTVPQSLYPEDSYTSHLDYSSSSASSPDLKPPPRNPRRLQDLRYNTAFAPTRSSSRYSADDSDPDDDASPTTIRRGAAALDMAQPLALEPVSPPSSPEFTACRTDSHARSVSPIDEDSDASLEEFVQAIKGNRRGLTPPADPPRYSQIPVAQRSLPAPPRGSAARVPAIDQAPAYQQAPSQRKPVSDEAAQWRPQPQSNRGYPQRPPRQAVIPERDSSFGIRSRQDDRRALPLETRPPWQGASGREQLVNPMQDDPNVAPLSLSAKGDKRSAGKSESHFRARLSHIGSPRMDGTSGPGAAMRKLLTSRTHKKANSMATQSPRAQYNLDANQQGHSSYPSPPYQDPYRMTSTSPQPQDSPGQSISIKRKPPPGAHVDRNSNHAHPLASSPISEDDIPKPPTPDSPVAPHNTREAWTQPGSRFSITTYATTAVGTPNLTSIENSPAIGMESPSLSMPTRDGPVYKNEHVRSISEAPFSTRNTLNPRPESAASDRTVNRSTRSVSDGGIIPPRRSSLSSISKPLPPAPPEVSAGDRVAHLSAQLEGLANRRLNINRCVKQMTELIPLDNLLASDEVQKKREMERKKVDVLKAELAEIQREEHELGLMLHRAYKRQNKEAEYEPTTLWVRRVAG
ncbi:hypothetical protein PWT90_09791 [Aphanocladium album]|nr:hypothetical protein PWT90_09791 [Aphanocladium album]